MYGTEPMEYKTDPTLILNEWDIESQNITYININYRVMKLSND